MFCDIAVEEGGVVLDSEDELFVFAEFLPNVRQVVLDSELVGSDVQQ